MFAEATTVSENFNREQVAIDGSRDVRALSAYQLRVPGILGFGFRGASQLQAPTLLDNLFEQVIAGSFLLLITSLHSHARRSGSRTGCSRST